MPGGCLEQFCQQLGAHVTVAAAGEPPRDDAELLIEHAIMAQRRAGHTQESPQLLGGDAGTVNAILERTRRIICQRDGVGKFAGQLCRDGVNERCIERKRPRHHKDFRSTSKPHIQVDEA